MSVWRIALGVFIGNLLFALLAWAVFTIQMRSIQNRFAASAAGYGETSNITMDDADRLEAEADNLINQADQATPRR